MNTAEENLVLTEQELRNLSGYWYRLGKKGLREAFGDYGAFVTWAIENGYCEGKWLFPMDPSKPIGPDNGQWRYPPHTTDGSGTAVPTEHPCRRCPQDQYCQTICKARAKWWDVQMKIVRKRLGL